VKFIVYTSVGHWSNGCHNTLTIRDAQDPSGIAPINPSRSFSVETLTGVTLSWKTELNRSISAMEDGIPRWLQHYYKACCEKDGLV